MQVQAYVFLNDPPHVWPDGNVPMVLKLGKADNKLIDGNSEWDVVAGQALTNWNAYLGGIQFSATTESAGIGGNGDHTNQVFFDSTVYGQAFGNNILAVTTHWFRGTNRTEADVIFDNAYTWDSFRGPLRSGIHDFVRVALHEFGHVLGLGHPDEAGQTVIAQMNSRETDLDALASDDITGAQVLYPGQILTITIQPQSQTVTVNAPVTFSVAATGPPPISYQWFFNGDPISNGTGTSFTIASVQVTQAGNYTVIVSSPAGTLPSEIAVLTVDAPPTITVPPKSQSVPIGNSVTFTVAALGTLPLAYQWFFNASEIPGATASSYSLSSVQPTNAGDYRVRVSNSLGFADSSVATLITQPPALKFSGLTVLSNATVRLNLSGTAGKAMTLFASSNLIIWIPLITLANSQGTLQYIDLGAGSFPSRFYKASEQDVATLNMSLIPAGSFEMGDTFAEGNADELPRHTVEVSAFYVDIYPVSKALWDEVYSWAVSQGYRFDNPGAGKAANHPVYNVNWFDAVKWCNARSEKAGRTPAYYTNATQTGVYRTGQFKVQNGFVNWTNGYRLPTESEWERAARGGLAGKRFSWGDTITHSQANYYSSTNSAFDISSTRGFHPVYNDNINPFTSPVGSFAANDYGLYDTAGNVWNWCWDWYGAYGSGSQTNAQGPVTGTLRTVRGGRWIDSALFCRIANRTFSSPTDTDNGMGFRAVLPPSQP